MGASIYWQSVKGRCITPKLRSKFLETLERVGYGLPCVLDDSAITTLRAIGATELDFAAACADLIDGIVKHGRVRVWAEY